MPFVLIGDFRGYETGGDGPVFRALAFKFASALAAVPRLRFVIQHIMPPGELEADEVTTDLADRIAVPPKAERWTYLWHCHTCKTAAGQPQTVPDGMRLLHKSRGHDIRRGKISQKAVTSQWKVNRAIVIGSAATAKAWVPSGFTILITSSNVPLAHAKKFDAVFLLRVHRTDHEANAEAIRRSFADRENVILLPTDLTKAAAQVVEWYAVLDGDIFDPEMGSEEAAELADQKQRAVAAAKYIAEQTGSPPGSGVPQGST